MARAQIAISTQMSPLASDENISIWDISTRNMLSTYRSKVHQQHSSTMLSIPRHCIDRIGYNYLINAYLNSPILNVWCLNRKDSLLMKMILPGNVRCLSITSDGCYCLAGIETKLYLWQISSGNLLSVLDKHYQPIRVIRITDDLSYFITGGEDGLLMIWNMAKVLVPRSQESLTIIDGESSQFEPDRIINDSSLAINDIYLSSGGGRQSRFVTCSEQSNLVKIYQLPQGIHIATISLPTIIISVFMNRIESLLFCGSIMGDIYEIKISQIGSNDSMELNKSSNDGDRCAHFDFSVPKPQESNKNLAKFSGHTAAICSMAITIDGQCLLTGSNDNTIRIWHINTKQCMKQIQCKGPISNLLIYPSMSGLFLHDSLLESSDYSMNSIDSNRIDISLQLPSTSSSNKNKTNKNFKFDSTFSRPNSIEQTLRTLPNPPTTIQNFQRDIFSLKFNPIQLIRTKLRDQQSISGHDQHQKNIIREVEPSKSGLLNAFDHGGCLWFRNNQTNGNEFWPWKNFLIPDGEKDLQQIYPQEKIDQELIRSKIEYIEKLKNLKKQQEIENRNSNNNNNKRQKIMDGSAKSLNNNSRETGGDPIADESSNGLDDSVILLDNDNGDYLYNDPGGNNNQQNDLQKKIFQLNQVNYQLYRYAIEEIFKNNNP